ncbi:MAG: hypothetical protein QF464_09590, partial [Myxococcota bacterium]|nr:hypothetical protein [Myxococcota bacterium]
MGGPVACDAAVAETASEGSGALDVAGSGPDAGAPDQDGAVGPGAEGGDPVDGTEPEDENHQDPAAPYLPIPTGPLGGERPAEVTLPDDYDPAVSWPLVMLLHGYSATGFIQDYYLGIGEQVDTRDFIYVLPEGTTDSRGRQFWNAVPGCCNWDGSDIDDFAYLVG